MPLFIWTFVSPFTLLNTNTSGIVYNITSPVVVYPNILLSIISKFNNSVVKVSLELLLLFSISLR